MTITAKLNRIFKSYKRGDEHVHALQDFTFELNAGEMVALVGPSGCGKSTCINMLAGVDYPDSGEIQVCGYSLTKASETKRLEHLRHHVGIIFQSFHLMPYLTVEENITLPLSIDGKQNHERVANLIDRVGLSHRKKHFPSELSGGEQQRTAVARALVHHPELVLADEPTGNLDQHTGDKILDMMNELRREEQVTLLVATHDLRLAKQADRIIHVKDGKLEQVVSL